MATRSSYDQIKEFGGKRYTGMAVGRSHKWRYDAGEWKERKVTPDRWEFSYAVVKRRAGRAPEGSGAPVGTAYHWYIIADQVVTKLDANSYTTEMVGHKLKVTHRRADKSSWAASERAKRKQLVKLLRELADDLESRPIEDQPATKTDAAANGKPASKATNGHRAPPAHRTKRAKPAAHRESRASRTRAGRQHRAPAHRARSSSRVRAA
jgi:hypothetical protein